jgi:hypothetical protein
MSEPNKRSSPRTPPTPARKDGSDQQPWRVEGGREPEKTGSGTGGRGPRFRFPRWLLWVTLILLVLNVAVARQVPDNPDRISVPFSYFQDQVQSGNVTKVNAQGDIVQGSFKSASKPPDAGDEVKPK